MRNFTILAAALTAGLAASLFAAPAKAGLLYASNGSSACEPTSSANNYMRYTRFAVTNVSNTDQYVTCTFPLLRETVYYPLLPHAGFDLVLVISSASPTTQTAVCNAQAGSGAQAVMATRSVPVSSTEAARLHFTKDELEVFDNLAMVSVVCSLPSNASIGPIFVRQPVTDSVLL
jgi:hypothetical protein